MWTKIKNTWNKIKNVAAPIGAGLLAVFAFIGGRSSNRRTVEKLESLNRQLVRDTEQLRRNNQNLERNLRERQRIIAGRRENSERRSSATLALQRKNQKLEKTSKEQENSLKRLKRGNRIVFFLTLIGSTLLGALIGASVKTSLVPRLVPQFQ